MRIIILILLTLVLSSCNRGTSNIKTFKTTSNINRDRALHMTSLELSSYFLVPVERGKLALAANFNLCETILPGSFYKGSCKDTLIVFFSKGHELELEKTLKNNIVLVDMDLVNEYLKLGLEKIFDTFYDENCVPIFQDYSSPASELVAALILLNVELHQDDYSGRNFMLANKKDIQFCRELNKK